MPCIGPTIFKCHTAHRHSWFTSAHAFYPPRESISNLSNAECCKLKLPSISRTVSTAFYLTTSQNWVSGTNPTAFIRVLEKRWSTLSSSLDWSKIIKWVHCWHLIILQWIEIKLPQNCFSFHSKTLIKSELIAVRQFATMLFLAKIFNLVFNRFKY